MVFMTGFPAPSEAAPYYFRYIDLVSHGDIVLQLEAQLPKTLAFLRSIPEERSLYRYAPNKWSIRQVLSHINDCERVFLFRAFWFARGFSTPLPSLDQDICADAARADDFSWASHVKDFESVRSATLTFFRNLSADAWMRTGVASDNPFTVRALAYITAGHVEHHLAILRERYS
jgi:DinB superfamily